MNTKSARRCADVVAPSLEPGERIELVDVAQIGKVSAKKQLGVSAASVTVGVLTGGTLIVALKPRAFFLVVTDRRLFLIDNRQGSVGKAVVAAIPRDLVRVTGPLRKGLLTLSAEVTIDSTPHRFSWGRIGGSAAQRVLTALEGAREAA